MARALEDRGRAFMSGPTNKEIYAAVMARDLAERATRQPEPSAAKHTAEASAADAKLIAAAPEMADLLRREPTEGHTYKWQQERRAVLAKAGL
jgi:hypothetical protein